MIQQAENAVKPGGKAHFSVYEGDGKGVGGVTQKGGSFQRNQKTVDYVPFVEKVFGAGNVTRKGKIITATKPIEQVQEQLKKFKSPKGTIFKRGGKFGGLDFPVGKVIGGNQVYFHKNYIGSQPKKVQDLYNSALEKLPSDHNFNTLMYMKGKGDTPDTIRFDESADFDTAREPTPGKMIAVDANGNVAERNSNQIFHHKWMWVGDDYRGFDVNKEYGWSKQWTSKVDNFSGIGKKENWNKILKEKGLELDAPIVDNVARAVPPKENQSGFIAFHGSGKNFDEFKLDKVGTGEGQGVFGYGLYFTESQAIADFYKGAVGKELRERGDKNFEDVKDIDPKTYLVSLSPKDDQLIDYSLPLSKQSKKVQKALEPYYKEYELKKDNLPLGEGDVRFALTKGLVKRETTIKDKKTQDALDKFVKTLKDVGVDPSPEEITALSSKINEKTARQITRELSEKGVKGIKYKAGTMTNIPEASKKGLEDANNYVIFDDNLINILAKYGIVGGVSVTALAKGQQDRTTGGVSAARGGAIKTYKEGGVVPMQEQMKFAFMNEGGVLADDGVDRDPVSGNEVPAGSMAEEVRDDVPAMLSEGEYVVPADVVRYHGIDKFEQLRDEAKAGLARMEADGRIGGQPVEEQEEFPFPVEELQGFDEGGVVGDIYPDVMGSPYTPGQRYPSSDRFPGVGFELRNFTNPQTGKTVVIPFYNGQPMQYIPPDFLEGGAATTGGGTFDPAADERSRQEDEAERARNTTERGMSDLAYDAATKALRGDIAPTAKAVSEMTPLELKAYNDQRNSIIGRTLANVPVLSFLLKLDEKRAKERSLDILAKGKNPENDLPLTPAEVSALREVVNQQERKGFLQAIGDWVRGQKFYDPNPRLGYESGQDFQQMYPDLLSTEYTPSPKTAPDFVTMGEIGTSAPFGTDLEGSPSTGDFVFDYGYGTEGSPQEDKGTVAEEAQKILDEEGMYDQKKVDKAAGERVDKLFNFLSSPAQFARELLGAKPAGAQTTSNSPLLQGRSEEDIATINQFSVGEASVPFDNIVNSPTLNRVGGNGPTALNGGAAIQNGRFVPYADTRGFLTLGAGYRLRDENGQPVPNISELSQEELQKYASSSYEIDAIKKETLKIFDEKKAFVNDRYGPVLDSLVNNKEISPATRTIVKRGLIDQNMQLINGTTAFTLADKALMDGNIEEYAKQLVGNYEKNGKPAFSYEEGATYKSPTPYVIQMAGNNKDILDNRNRAVAHSTAFLNALANDKKDTTWKDDLGPLSQSIPKQELVSQPLQQTYTPPQAPTADDIRLAGGLDSFVGQTFAPTGTEQRTTGLQDLPVGVSIEADGQFTGTGGLGAVQPVRTPTPIVRRDFLDPSMSMSRREVLSDPTRFRGPSGAGIGPISEDASLQTGLATDFNRFTERVDRTPITVQRTADDKPIVTQTEAMLGSPSASSPSFSFDPERNKAQREASYRSFVEKREAERQAEEARKEKERFEREQKRLQEEAERNERLKREAEAKAKAAEQAVKDAISFTPKATKRKQPKEKTEETISQQEYEKRVADATRRENEKARDRADSARDSVLRQGGSVQEAFDAAQTAFTGFTPSGEFVGPTDPGTAAMQSIPTFGAFKEGGLASKPKKTKPKKRNTKKGLGGRMAT